MNDEIVTAIVNLRKQTGRVEERLPLMPLNNYAGAAAPTEDDDVTQGWTVLSEWFYDGDIYKCFSNNEGAAVWRKIQFVTPATYDTIAFVGSTGSSTAASTTLAVNKHASLAVGHVMLATVFVDSNSTTITAETDWVSQKYTSDGGMGLYTFSKVADAADVAASTFTFTASVSDGIVAVISVWSGVDNTTPVGNTSENTDNTGTDDAPIGLSVTSTIANSMIVYSSGQQSGSVDYNPISGWDQVPEEDLGSSPFGSVTQFYKTQATAGASGDVTGSLDGAQVWHVHMLVLNPAEL